MAKVTDAIRDAAARLAGWTGITEEQAKDMRENHGKPDAKPMSPYETWAQNDKVQADNAALNLAQEIYLLVGKA